MLLLPLLDREAPRYATLGLQSNPSGNNEAVKYIKDIQVRSAGLKNTFTRSYPLQRSQEDYYAFYHLEFSWNPRGAPRDYEFWVLYSGTAVLGNFGPYREHTCWAWLWGHWKNLASCEEGFYATWFGHASTDPTIFYPFTLCLSHCTREPSRASLTLSFNSYSKPWSRQMQRKFQAPGHLERKYFQAMKAKRLRRRTT